MATSLLWTGVAVATSSWSNTAVAAKTSIGVEVIEKLVAIAVSEVDCIPSWQSSFDAI